MSILGAAIGSIWELPFEIPYIVWLQSIAGKGSFLYYLMNFISMFGEELVLVGVLGLVYWGLDKKRGEKIGMFMLTATLLNPMIKNIACRTRPFDAHPFNPETGEGVQNLRDVDGYSFPSGHSSGSASVFLGTAFAYKDKKHKWLWAIAIVIPILVAFSRNYLGAHYPTDVVAGLALGVVCVLLVELLTKVVKNKYFIYGGILVVGLAGFFYCTTSDFFTAYGIAIGLTLGVLFEEKVVHFENTRCWWRILLRVGVGGALFLGLNEGLKLLVGAFGDKVCLECGTVATECVSPNAHDFTAWFNGADHIWFEHIFRTLRYALVVFLMIGVYPLLFAQTEKPWKKFGWIKRVGEAESTATVAQESNDEIMVTYNSEEKIEFDVVLKSVGENKIPVIKVVRELTGLGLADAVDLVERAPVIVKEAQSKEAAENMVNAFAEVGAEAELK